MILSDGFWKRHFGGAPDALGRIVRINDVPHTVIGIMPPSFHIDHRDYEQFYTPLPIDSSRGHGFLHVIGRLREGATLRQAAADLAAIADRLARLYPRTNTAVGTNLVALTDGLARHISLGLFTMLGVVSIVLLIACANVAGLMLARGAARKRELAIRAALGAGTPPSRAAVLDGEPADCASGGGLGLIAADWSSRALAVVMPEQFHVSRIDTANTDLSVLTFTVLVSFGDRHRLRRVSGLFASTSPDLNEALRDAGRSATARARRASDVGSSIAEIALALVLFAGAGC